VQMQGGALNLLCYLSFPQPTLHVVLVNREDARVLHQVGVTRHTALDFLNQCATEDHVTRLVPHFPDVMEVVATRKTLLILIVMVGFVISKMLLFLIVKLLATRKGLSILVALVVDAIRIMQQAILFALVVIVVKKML